jgi:hypothetical protein
MFESLSANGIIAAALTAPPGGDVLAACWIGQPSSVVT